MATTSKKKKIRKNNVEAQIEPDIKPEVKDTTNEKINTFNDKLSEKARKLLVASQVYKQPRMNTLALYERLYNNDVLPKLRQMFNSVLPIFSGMVDELLAMFNDDIDLKFKAKNPAQELVTPKIQAHFNAESSSLVPTALWGYKGRVGRFNAVISGRIIQKIFAYNDPQYTNVLVNVNYSDFHCESLGGGILENHQFCGTEGNFKTLSELKNNSKYNQDQVKKLEDAVWDDEMFINLENTYGTKFARWRSLGFDVETNSFSGEHTFNLCDFVVTDDGVRYNIVFEPCTGIWVCVEEWKEQVPSGEYPYKSGATHEDDKNFWNKSYADDFFTIADAVLTLFNQELTNREKKNYNARAFDKDMFPDVAKLDAAQYRPDALVPANTMGGTKKISDGLYAFETPELTGTINLIDWMSGYTGSKTGAEEAPAGGKGKQNVSMMLAQQQKQSKRVGLRSDSFQDFYMQLGRAYLEGLKECMEPKVSVQVVGENGFIEEQELTRIEVQQAGAITISVASDNEQENQDTMKKEAKAKAIQMVSENPSLTPFEKEVIYRDIGGFDEADIIFLLDKQGDLTRKQYANASRAIQDILLSKKPEIYYGADSSYIKYMHQYLVDNKNKIKGKEKAFMDFLTIMEPVVTDNMKMLAALQPKPQPEDGADPNAKPNPAGGGGAPAAKQQVTIPAVAQRMGQAA